MNKTYNKFLVSSVSDDKEKDLFLVNSNSEDEIYDDCPVCQVMKKAKEEGREPTMEEIKKAMEESQAQGGIIGGKWFDKKHKN